MHIQINTDKNIKGHEAYRQRLSDDLQVALLRLSRHITRVEVHLTDENGPKIGVNEKRCVIEARMEGRQPIAVTHYGITADQAFSGATEKLIKMVENISDRLQDIERTNVASPEGPVLTPEE
ncbi:MAG: HPF/RaiA family ribosome-associated protein [Bacteroidota bacterium]